MVDELDGHQLFSAEVEDRLKQTGRLAEDRV
jgi:hypothetical protein